MNEIKVGDWIEVVEPTERHNRMGIKVGNIYEVLNLSVSGVFIKQEGLVYIHYGRIKKVEPSIESPKLKDVPKTKIERVASSHYQNANNNDVWQFADDNLSEERVKGFHQVNAIKYITRYHIKHDTMEKRIEDLEKAKVYIDKLIELERQA